MSSDEARAEAEALSWSMYRNEVAPNPRHAGREAVAFKAGFDAGAEWQAEQDEQAQHAYTVRHLHDSHWRCACGHPLVDVSEKAGPASKDVLMAVHAAHEAHKRERGGKQVRIGGGR